MTNAYNPPPARLPKRKEYHLGVVIDDDLLERLRRHRDRLDAKRVEVDVTTMSATVRFLLVQAMDAIERDEP
jgi:hypothetical protein